MTEKKFKPIIAVDFDGVIHSYTSGWQGADVIPDPPVEGAIEWLLDALRRKDIKIVIFSTRAKEGKVAMKEWLQRCAVALERDSWYEDELAMSAVEITHQKPPAIITIDDRAYQFKGKWPSVDDLINFQPWNKVDPSQLAEDSQITTGQALDHLHSLFMRDRGALLSWQANIAMAAQDAGTTWRISNETARIFLSRLFSDKEKLDYYSDQELHAPEPDLFNIMKTTVEKNKVIKLMTIYLTSKAYQDVTEHPEFEEFRKNLGCNIVVDDTKTKCVTLVGEYGTAEIESVNIDMQE